MSKQYWNSVGNRNLLQSLVFTMYLTMIQAKKARLQYDVDLFDSKVDSDDELLQEPAVPYVNMGATLALTVGTLLQHAEVYKTIEDTSIEFGRRLTVENFNESQCLMHFWFKKLHLIKVLDALWPRLQEFVRGTRDCIECVHRYKCPYETAMLILLYRFARPRRLCPDMEEFFGMRKSHISSVLDTITEAMYSLSYPYLNNPIIFQHRFPIYGRKIYRKCGLLEHV